MSFAKVCRYCQQEIPEEILQAKTEIFRKRIKDANNRRRSEGLPIGRPRIRNRYTAAVAAARIEGLSMRGISNKLQMPIGMVQRCIKDAGLK